MTRFLLTQIEIDSNDLTKSNVDIGGNSTVLLDSEDMDSDPRTSLLSQLADMSSLTMKHEERNKMFKHCSEIVQKFSQLTKKMIHQDNGMSPLNVIEAVTTFFCTEIDLFNSRHKREKRIIVNPLYVAPQEKAIGTRIEQKWDKTGHTERPFLIQSTLQMVSIISSLKSFFARPENLNMYFNFQSEHQCVPGVYKYFCCGDVYKSEEFFQLNKNAIQLQLAIDDVEICDPLGSKNNVHKVCNLYFVIRNIPPRYNSKLNNIFLACLCNVDDLKTEKTDINNILEIIVDEILYLEKTGIILDNGQVLKGTLVSLAADNLGTHNALSLVESFRSVYFCRICKVSRECSQDTFKDNIEEFRDRHHYEQMLEIINNCEKVDFKETFGIKRYCTLNNLKFFDIFKNVSVDIMHDLNEGVVDSLLLNIFMYLTKNKAIKEIELQNAIKFYNYPKYFRRDKPSNLKMGKDRKTLGLNSAQMKCLFLNLPFILAPYENNSHMKKVWPCVKRLLRVFQIVHSEVFDEMLLQELELCTEHFLKTFKDIFVRNLTPKHHFMVHYANIIRRMGPLIYMSMMRFDAKHTFFKNVVRHTNNFININKTMAIKHQQSLINNGNTFCDKFTNTKEKPIDIDFIENAYGNTVLSHIRNSSKFSELDSFFFNSLKYERGSIVSYKKKIYEIEMIILSDNSYFMVAFELEFLGLHEYSQSIAVKKPNDVQFSMIKFCDLSHIKPYCSKFIGSNQYVIIDNRDILGSLC